MEFTGKIIAILQPRGGVSKASGNEWKAQEYVIEDHGQYPRKMCFDVFGADKIEQFNIQMGADGIFRHRCTSVARPLVQQYPRMESGTCQRSNGSACTGSTGSAARSVRSAGILIRRRKGRLAFLI